MAARTAALVSLLPPRVRSRWPAAPASAATGRCGPGAGRACTPRWRRHLPGGQFERQQGAGGGRRSPAPTPGCSTSAKSPLVSAWLRPPKPPAACPMAWGWRVTKPRANSAPRSRHPQRGGECAWPLFGVHRPWPPPARFATGQVGVCRQATSAPRPCTPGLHRHHALGCGGASAAPAHPANPAWQATPRWQAKLHRSQPGTRSSQGRDGRWWHRHATPWRAATALVAQLQGLALPCNAWLARVKADAIRQRRSLAPSGSGGEQRRRDLARVRWNTARGATSAGHHYAGRPCPRPAACFAAAKRLRQRLRHGGHRAAGIHLDGHGGAVNSGVATCDRRLCNVQPRLEVGTERILALIRPGEQGGRAVQAAGNRPADLLSNK